jgi:hypothetical protein
MKPVLIAAFLLLTSFNLHSQPGAEDLQKQVAELRARIKTLEKEKDLLKSQERSNDSVTYCALRSEIFEAYTNIPQLDFDFKNTAEKIAVTGLFAKLMQANNPTSDILGFRFTEVIFSSAEKHFKETLKEEKDKKRFSEVITKVIDNPVVSALANTNPITSVVSSIISIIAGFTTSRVELGKEGGRIKDVSVDQKDAFDNRSISAFRNELQVYIDFYDALILASAEYLEGLEDLNGKYAYLILSVKDYKTQLYTGLDVKESNVLIKLSRLLPDPATHDINFSAFIQDPRIQKTRHLAGIYPLLHQNVNDFKKEYNTLLFNFLSDYINTLKTAKNFPDGDIDKSKTDDLITDIESFINSQKSKEREDLDAFK